MLAAREYLSRFELLFDRHTVFDGVTYTDAHVTLPACSLFRCAVAWSVHCPCRRHFKATRTLAGRGLCSRVICYVAAGMVGWYVTSFLVKPNELVREQPYIANNIEMTRQAYGLDRFSQREFPAETTVGATDPANNQPTLQNIRLWDVTGAEGHAAPDSGDSHLLRFSRHRHRSLQIDGSMREVMLAARELNVDKLPESSRNWINDKLIYTHGYGITMNPVNGFTPKACRR
jgi:uncharacterized protein